jgi:hypothetical protein
LKSCPDADFKWSQNLDYFISFRPRNIQEAAHDLTGARGRDFYIYIIRVLTNHDCYRTSELAHRYLLTAANVVDGIVQSFPSGTGESRRNGVCVIYVVTSGVTGTEYLEGNAAYRLIAEACDYCPLCRVLPFPVNVPEAQRYGI